MWYIYLTENIVNGRLYIGKHKGGETDSYLGSGTILKRAIIKYGIESFKKTILAIADCEDAIDDLEIYYISKYRKEHPGKLYNLTDGGTGGNTLKYLPTDIVSKTRSGWYSKMSSDEQIRLSDLKRSQMIERRADPIIEAKRIKKLKETVNNKSVDQRWSEYNNRRGSNAYQSIPVSTPLGIFPTLCAAAKMHGLTGGAIRYRCNSKNFTEWNYIK